MSRTSFSPQVYRRLSQIEKEIYADRCRDIDRDDMADEPDNDKYYN